MAPWPDFSASWWRPAFAALIVLVRMLYVEDMLGGRG